MNIPEILIFQNKKIGVSISGGADSAVLSYFLMKNVKDPLHFFTYASKEKQNRTVKNSISVLEKCISLTGKNNIYHYIKYAEVQQRDQFLDFLLAAVDNSIVDIIYTATTSTPPASVLNNFNEQLSTDILERRNPNYKKLLYSHSYKLYHPFINIDKKSICNIYQELDLLNSLFPTTNSCESLEQHIDHCGKCWWCQERAWAFEKP